MALLGTDDFKDARIDKIVYKVLELTDRDTQWICVGERLSDQMGMSVISFGEDAFGDDLEELKKKDIPVPDYLRKMELVLHGPDVFGFTSW